MTVTVNHAKTNAISDWTQAQLDEQIALGNFAPGTTLANIVLPSDWNDDHTLTGLGTMAEQNANSVAITGGSVNGTTIGATTASTGKFTSVTTPSVTATTTDLTLSAISTGVVNLNTLAGKAFAVTDHPFTAGGANVNFTRAFGGQTGYSTGIMAQGSDGTVVLAQSSKGATSVQFFTSSFGAQQFNISHTASAVNYVQVTGSATTARPVVSAQGSDANITLALSGKGGGVQLFQNGTSSPLMFEAVAVGSAVNYFRASPSITAQAVPLSAQGTDTNISMAFQPKGTGAIDLAAGSRGVNISNGGTVTAITRTAAGTGYTSPPTVAITAPTTAGGVQATATTFLQLATTPTITSGGTGYTVGDVLTFVGGTIGLGANAAQVTVTTVSSGVITGVSITTFGTGYSVVPTNPISVTGGSGLGATFTVSGWQVSSFTITNAGSGYIEQPTITFSGGGGSGAAAYATVGSGTTVKTLGSSISFNVPSSEVLRLTDGASAACYLNLQSSSTTIQGFAASAGSNVGYQWVTKGVSNHSFTTNNSVANEQLRVSHTASAVNYVQVTGAATGGNPAISVQGSDANAGFIVASKGTGLIRFDTGTTTQFRILNTASAINRIDVTGSAAGAAPSFACSGTDTNIDLALTPKGTGLVRFGTYVAGALTATGYINIKAADGTTYKVLVST